MAAVRAPSGLGKPGRALWRQVTEKYELRVDEQLLLEQCARSADLIDRLEAAAREAGLTTTGSQGQAVINPVIAEIRLQKRELSRLLFQLGLPDDDAAGPGLDKARSVLARKAALQRWSANG